MAYVILQHCCNDASCVAVCPVDCIHPTPDEPGFMRAEMLHIDPQTCVDCGACVDECPVEAIKSEEELDPEDERFPELNAEYFVDHPIDPDAFPMPPAPAPRADLSGLRVAIVGSGPAAFYAALELEAMNGPRIDMFERLYTPYGLVRFGVAPDHQATKAVTEEFRSLERRKAFRLNLGVEIGTHLTHEELLAHHHAVIYAVGGSTDRRLGIDGEDLPGSHAATEFVSWYNGHPDYADRTFDLSGERAVIVGNGNVALDVARILLSDPDELDRTDIADHALEALRASNVREVVVVGRRGIAQAGYTNPEMIALCRMPGVDVVVDGAEPQDEVTRALSGPDGAEAAVRFKVDFAREIAARGETGQPKRLVLKYLASPTRIDGTDRVEGIRLGRNLLERGDDGAVRAVATGEEEALETGLVFRSVGYRGSAIPGVPFDDVRGIIPNEEGRVHDPASGEGLPGVYVSGWIKRGPSGVIGTNKKCASDTVAHLVRDYLDGVLADPTEPDDAVSVLVAERRPETVDFAGWALIDRAERQAGAARGRARVKFVDAGAMLEAARPAVPSPA